MNIIRNEKSIKRNAMIGKITSIVSLAILAAGMYITFRMPEEVSLSLSALLIGFVLSQMGIYYTNRWGRSPRPDEQIDAALKGFSKQNYLYHYTTPASHVLVGPSGIWVLLPKHQKGTIAYRKNRWKKSGGGALAMYLSLFAQEGLGRPDLEIASEVDALQRALRKQLPDQELPPVQAVLVFTHPDVDIQADDAPSPAVSAKKLKEFMRKLAKDKPLSTSDIEMVVGAFGE